jgi:DNA mismatch repair protein MutS2
LEDDLSTYSSHLLNMKSLLEQADSRTLFLIDECGSGTDPQVGGAIAEAIIEDLNARKAFGVITTHYSNLKLLSDNPHNQGSIVNGAMLFDQKDMKPLYVLSIGKPGSSFAFEIARSTGLPDRIIHNALAKTGEGIMNFEQQLQQLEVEKENLKRREEQFQMADTLLAETIAKYERMIADFSSRKTEILLKAKQEAEQIMEGANRRIENVIAEIKTHNAEREITNSARNELNREISNLKTDLKRTKDNINSDKTHSRRSKRQIKESTPQFRFDNTPIAENDFVYLVGNNSVAQVLRLKKNRIEVSCGNLTMTLPIEEVQKIDKTSYLANEKKKRQTGKSITPSVNRSLMADINKKRAEFKYQIDLRGQKAEQALIIVAKQIDDARLLGEREFAVLHGTGDGILKVVIRDFLKTSSEVASFRPAVLENGGEGITIVKLN